MPFHEYQVIGRLLPTEKDPNPKIYRMSVFAKNELQAKSRFWYFVSQQYKAKKGNGQVISVSRIYDSSPTKVKNFGAFLRYDCRTGTINMYKEYRDVTREGAVTQIYSDMAGKYRARFRNMQIVSLDEIAAKDTKRANTKQFHDAAIKFPLPHRVFKVNKAFRTHFKARRPSTHFG